MKSFMSFCLRRPKVDPMMNRGLLDVLEERKRQIMVEGFDAKHDDLYTKGELPRAAVCYILPSYCEFLGYIHSKEYILQNPPNIWPFHKSWWKPKSKRENLIKALALGLAELDRMDRMGEK